MAASMKDIKLRINSVTSTMQITKAMELVASSKLRRAQERIAKSRPYFETLYQTLSDIAAKNGDTTSPYTQQREVKRVCWIVIAGDRGLAGGYNSNIFKAVAQHCQDTPYCVLPLGRKAVEKFQRAGIESLSNEYTRVEGMSVGCCYKLAKTLIENYQAEKFDELFLVYTSFKTMMTQEVALEQLLPVPPMEDAEKTPVSTIYELDPVETLQTVMPDFLAGRMYSALCDSFASEVASRRSAMDSATKNAGEMISDLRLKYNRARQGAITQEITEIVAGAEQ